MPQSSAPIDYSLPYTIRISNSPLIAMTAIMIPLIAILTYLLVVQGPGDQFIGWVMSIGIDICFALYWLAFVSQQILLSDELLS